MRRPDETSPRIQKAVQGLPKDGFIKVTRGQPGLGGAQKAALVRKGNQLFNQGQYDLAKRIFMTTGYSDGLIRLGDHYIDKKMPLEAFRMFWLARYRKKTDSMVETMTEIVKDWLK